MGFGKFFKKVVAVALPIVGAVLGGPIGAAIGSAIAGRVSTGSWKGWARNALIGGATAWAGGAIAGKGWNPLTQSQNAWNSATNSMSNWGNSAKSANVGNSGSEIARKSGSDALASQTSGSGQVMGQASNSNAVNTALSGSNGGIGGGFQNTLQNIGEFAKSYGPNAVKLAQTGMKLYSAMEAQDAYDQLAAQMQAGGQLNQYAIDALMQMEKNPEVYLNSPEVKAARDRAMEIVKRNAAAKGETYSTNAINDYITQSLLVDTNALANRRNYLAGMAQSPEMTMAQMGVANGRDNANTQMQGALTELGGQVFGEDAMTQNKGLMQIGS